MIVMLDACRADKFGAWGFGRPTTPVFDRLSRDQDATRFLWQISQAPHTKASTASLFTGRYPFQHGVIVADLLSELDLKSGRYADLAIAPSFVTLAEAFQTSGYRTMAASAISHLASASGFAQGFDQFLEKLPHSSDQIYLDSGLDFLSARSQPSFVYVHLRACHNPLPKWRRDAVYYSSHADAHTETEMLARGIDIGDISFKLAIRRGSLRLDPSQIEFVNAAYESILRRVDSRLVAHLVDELHRRDLYDKTLLVVSADHGEELFDHANYAHGHTVWNEVVHVPLVVKFPKGGRPSDLGNRVERITQTIGLYPALLRYAGIEPPPDASATDIFENTGRRDVAFTQAPETWALFDMPFKLVVNDHDGWARLFDLDSDARELHDVSNEHRDVFRRLRRLGEGIQATLARVDASQGAKKEIVDQATIEELRSLGYIQ